MKGLSAGLLFIAAVLCTASGQYGGYRRSFRNNWDTWVSPIPISSSEEVSSEEVQPLERLDSFESKGDLGEPQSFEADDREFTYYPVAEKFDQIGSVFYEVIDDEPRSARGGGKGKKGKKGCKKGKKKKGKKKGRSDKKKKGKKGCGEHGGWWYVWDKKHGYISGRWGDPPPKGLEREHYDHGFGHHGHKFGKGYDGHGKMGGGGQGGGGGGGGGGGQHGWGWKPQKKVEHYHHGWLKPKGWGW